MSHTVYTVKGMTCGHCASSVTEEVSQIDGVTNVAVDVASGAVTVSSERKLSAEEVRAAVTEAGYELVS